MNGRVSDAYLDVVVLGPDGETRMRIMLTKNGIYWFWTAYRSERSAGGRFSLFLDSFEPLERRTS